MKAAISRSRFIDWLKSLQFVIFAHPTISKRTFAVLCINHQLTSHIDVRHKRTCLNTFSKSKGRSLYSSEASYNLNDVPVVKVSVHIPDNSSNPIIAVYWDDSNKCNRFKEYPEKSAVKAEIEAISLALKQAIFQMNLPRIRIVTNSKFVWNHFGKTSLWWSLDEFLQQKSMVFNFCSAEAEDLYRLLHMIDATIQYNSSIDEQTEIFRRNLMNEKISKLKSDLIPKNSSVPQTSSIKAILAKEKKKSTGIFVQGTSSDEDSKNHASKNLLNSNVPTVYTRGVLHIEGNEKKYMKAGYGVYWPHAHELGIGKRYNFFPVTLIRCQLQAIIVALQQAAEQNYQNIVLHTDCVSFLVHHSRQWLKANGSHVRYYDQYLRIMDLCKDIKVRFQSANDRVALSEAEALAENGVCLPLPSRRSRKSMYSSRTSATTRRTSYFLFLEKSSKKKLRYDQKR
ncbi:Ribonuclease [Dirofilaria immitis]